MPLALIRPVTTFFEGRLPSPFWRRFTHLLEYYFRLRVSLRSSAPDDADLSDRFCPVPFENFEAHENGSVFLCCNRWLPTPAGNVNRQDPADVWNSQRAQDIRRSILDGTFKYCNRDLCPAIVANNLPTRAQARANPAYRDIIDRKAVVIEGTPKLVNLTNDRSCNLSCPSCRTRRLNFSTGHLYELRKRLQDRLNQAFFSKATDQAFTVNVTGTGDPFASRVFREFLYGLDGKDFPNLSVQLQTNGTLFNEKTWKKLNKIHANITLVAVSFDAACEQTYKITRRGGNWYHLVKNTQFLAGLRRRGLIEMLRLDFVAQQANFREMPRFVELGKGLGADLISFSKAVNWGTWNAAEYRNVCVWDLDHPDFAAFQDVISQPVFDDPKVYLGNLTQDRRRALRRPVRSAATR